MNITIHHDPTQFEALTQDWNVLFERATTQLIFTTHLYQRTWWRCLGNDDLRLITIRNDADELVGLAPLYRTVNQAGQRQLNFVGCVDVSDYLDLLVDRDYVPQVYRAVLDGLAQDPTWDRISLCSLPHTSLTLTELGQAAQARGWQVEVRQQDVCPVITLADDWETYLAALNKKQRHEIRRKVRKLESESEARWYVIDSEAGLADAMEKFIELHRKSTQDKEEFWSERLVQFFHTLAFELVKAGWLKLFFIDLDGTPNAALFCFDYNNEFLLYNSGYDPASFAHLSPGNVLIAYTIQDAIRLGRTRYDFLRGDEVYKFRFGAVPEPVYDLEISRGTAR